jgi:erythromycin esterase
MSPATDQKPFTDWLQGQATPLSHLDPAAPLDDLEPLRDILDGARVVALGEHSHFIDEFATMRRRILRFPVERCGVTVLAFEYGFSEGFPLDAWAHGQGTDDDLSVHLAAAIPMGIEEPLRFLRRIDPETLPTVQSAMTIAASFAGDSAAVAAPAWACLAAAEQDTLSALLARLLIRFRSLEPLYVSRGDQHSYDIALRCLEGACHADYTFRALAALFTGGGLTADTSARDLYMAESLMWHLNRLEPTARVVLVAHNAHIQKTPIAFDGHLTGLPMGQHLHNALGDAYFALGLTSVTGHTGEMHRDERARFGFTVHDTALEPPVPGSIEAALADTGLGLCVADLRQARAEHLSGPDRIRMQSVRLHTPVVEVFDGILSTPASTVADLEKS